MEEEQEKTQETSESTEAPAETPAEPIRGFILFLENRFINFAISNPAVVPIQKATIPRNSIPIVSRFKNRSDESFEPTPRPKKIVVIFIKAF